MKLPATLLAAAALAANLFPAAAQVPVAPVPAAPVPANPVRLTVQQQSKTENKGLDKIQTRTLKITLVNSGPDSLPLRVQYAFFGRAGKSHDTIIVDQSDLTTQLQPKSDQTLTTKPQSAKFTDEHFDKGKKIEASGQKFAGYGVRVYQDGKVIAETCDPSSMQDDLAKMPGLPGAKPAPAPNPAAPAAKPAPKPKPATPAPSTPAPAAK